MQIDLETLYVEKVIVHHLPQKLEADTELQPLFSDVESPITSELANYLRERLVKSLSAGAFPVVADPNTTSPVPAALEDYLASEGDLIAMSRLIGQHLFNSQTRQNPSGLLCVAATRLEGRRSVVVLKLEMEEAVRLGAEEHGGKTTFHLELLRDLVLNKTSRILKVAFFELGAEGGRLSGIVADKQRGFQPQNAVADFFLNKFLGCTLADAPEITTKRFFSLVQDFVNERVEDPVQKAQYQASLISELVGEEPEVSAAVFAERYLEEPHQAELWRYAEENHFPADQSFEKDNQLIDNRLRRIQIEFSNGMVLIARPEVLDQHLRQTPLGNGRARFEFEDSVKEIHGRQ
ncbi:MAG: nucleoid-associated protein [Actinomycetota bacterium]